MSFYETIKTDLKQHGYINVSNQLITEDTKHNGVNTYTVPYLSGQKGTILKEIIYRLEAHHYNEQKQMVFIHIDHFMWGYVVTMSIVDIFIPPPATTV